MDIAENKSLINNESFESNEANDSFNGNRNKKPKILISNLGGDSNNAKKVENPKGINKNDKMKQIRE